MVLKDKQLIKEADNLADEFYYGSKKYNNFGKFILLLKFLLFLLKVLKKEPRTIIKVFKEL